MAQHDLLLTQNTHVSGVEFSEKLVNIAKGGLLSADTSKVPTVLAGGTDGYMLVRDDAEVTGLKWIAISAGHTQGTDAGTTGTVFELDTDGFKIELTAESASKFGVKVDGGATYADLQAKDATFAQVSGTAAPTSGNHLTNKTYVDGILAANDAMIFCGTIGTGGTHTIATFNALTTYNAGWAYKVVEAGTIRGAVCQIGDMVVVVVDRTGSSNANGDFVVIQTNIDGAVVGPTSVADNAAVVFDGVTGKLIKAHASGALGTAAFVATGTFATSAQGTLADAAIPKGTITAAEQIVIGTDASTPGALTVGASTFVGRKVSGSVSAMSVAEALSLLSVASGATANAKATGAEIDTATDDIKFATAKAIADSKLIKGPGTVVDNVPLVWDSTTGKLVKSHASGALGTAAFSAATAFASSAQGTTADGAVPKSTYDSHTILAATTDNTPAALTVGELTIVGRKTGGNIAALTPAEVMNVLWVSAPATKTSAGTAGQLAKDGNYLYVCDGANLWSRTPRAVNW